MAGPYSPVDPAKRRRNFWNRFRQQENININKASYKVSLIGDDYGHTV